MRIELLQPMKFGTGEYKVGDEVEVAHTLAGEMIKAGRARDPKGVKKKKKKGSRGQGAKGSSEGSKNIILKNSHPRILEPLNPIP